MPKIPQPIEVDQPSLSKISFTVDTGAKTLDIGVKEPLIMSLPDASNPGSYVEQLVTPPATIKGDGHASENFNLGEAGQTLAVAWAENYPITWYITVLSGVTYWVCSRNPCMTQMPAAAGYIGDFTAEPATATTLQTNVFIAASVTVADFVDLPVWPIGTMPVQRAANSQIPTLQALTAGKDGAGLWNEETRWTFPVNQNGAIEDTYLYVAGGDASGDVPKWTTNQGVYYYYTKRDGSMPVDFSTVSSGARASAGDVASQLYIALPLAPKTSARGVLFGFLIIAGNRDVGYAAGYNGAQLAVKGITVGTVNATSLNDAADDLEIYNTFQVF